MLYGVDLSQFNGTVNWDALNAVANFVLIRATDGTIVDTEFVANQEGARRVQASAGPLGIGYYTHTYPTLLTASESADFFLSTVGIKEGEVLVQDLEGTLGPDPVAWSLAFAQAVEMATGVKTIIYLNQDELNGYDWTPYTNGNYGLWLADHDTPKEGPAPSTKWGVVAFVQYTDADIVAGVSGKVDGDTFYGDFAAFQTGYGYKPESVPTPEQPVVQPPEPVAPPVEVPVTTDQPNPETKPEASPAVAPVETEVKPETFMDKVEDELESVVDEIKKVL